ncbi:MAG: hypothetical protein QGG38_04290 [Nitrospinaceae bacterium]|jgi:hypothetical protein|nr:hypothetical protein [Nitrospinaceae bacterium]MDP6711894.1 hypothetical protein [Nitrospinaceae bacterium]HAK38142.1 hypothetical protein [Nitrospina sp.]|tara:strand:- start:208 stop:471 length:264 start_codon:yes stop_codon:yes gene_type:complete
MSFDFMKNPTMFDDEERFVKLCETIEDAIRETDDGEGKFSDLEVMQAIDFVGFNLFRDNWEEFKKMESPREFNGADVKKPDDKKYIN